MLIVHAIEGQMFEPPLYTVRKVQVRSTKNTLSFHIQMVFKVCISDHDARQHSHAIQITYFFVTRFACAYFLHALI